MRKYPPANPHSPAMAHICPPPPRASPGTFVMCHAAFPELRKSPRSTIINISATLQEPATWYQAHASAAKAAIDSLTRSLALEWGHLGISVVGIRPGATAGTPGMAKLAPTEASGSKDDLVTSTIPLGRMGMAVPGSPREGDLGRPALEGVGHRQPTSVGHQPPPAKHQLTSGEW